MAWASSGGYPGVVSGGYGALNVPAHLLTHWLAVNPGGLISVQSSVSGNIVSIQEGQNNSGLALKNGVGLFDHSPPAAATAGGAHTAGGTYTAVEQAMLEAVYTALQSIGLVT